MIATLGMGTIIVGLNFAYSSGVPIVAGVPEAFLEISLGRFYGIPNNVIVMVVVLGFLWFLVERTSIGQAIQAVGGNPAAARLSGINVDGIKILGFVISGVCAAIDRHPARRRASAAAPPAPPTAICSPPSPPCSSARPRLRDGEFHVFGTFIGVLIIAVGFNGLAIFGAPTFYAVRLPGRDPDRRRRPVEPRPRAFGGDDMDGRSGSSTSSNMRAAATSRSRA